MYAIIAESGRQYKVEAGQEFDIDYREAQPGDAIRFERVLAVRNDSGFQVGRPLVEGATVEGEIVGTFQGPKVVVQKFRRRKNSRRKTGHRQMYTRVKITGILAG